MTHHLFDSQVTGNAQGITSDRQTDRQQINIRHTHVANLLKSYSEM